MNTPPTERTAGAIGATAVRQQFGYDGSGVGIAIIDSGITGYHDELYTIYGPHATGIRHAVFGDIDLVRGTS